MRFKLMSVDVGNNLDTIWTIDNNQRVWMLNDGEWVNDPNARAKQLSVGNENNVWCVNPEGQIFSGHAGGDNPNFHWHENSLPNGTQARKVSVGIDGEVWALDVTRHLWRRESDGKWSMDTNAQDVVEVGVGSVDHVYCVNENGLFYKRAGTSWSEISDNNTDVFEIAVASDGAVCYVAQNHDLKIYNSGGFDSEGTGRGVSISVANANELCVVNDDAELWQCADEEWEELDGPDFGSAVVYFVQDGDTLSKIANALDIELNTLVAANPQITNADAIQIGERVNLPS